MLNLERVVSEVGRRIGVWVDGLDRSPDKNEVRQLDSSFFPQSTIGGTFDTRLIEGDRWVIGRLRWIEELIQVKLNKSDEGVSRPGAACDEQCRL